MDHLIVFGVAFATVALVTPLVRRLATWGGAVAEPGERHVHTRRTPTLGGLAIFAGVLAAIGVGSRLGSFAEVFRTTSEPEAAVLAGILLVAIGVVDDTRGVSAPAKLAGQTTAAGILVLLGGIQLRFVYIPGNPGSIVSLNFDLAALLTIFAVVAMINAVNLVDGLDGLAAGIVAIAATALFFYAVLSEAVTDQATTSAPLLLAAVSGASLGFLLHNFNPASIFMGDTGAMLLGMLLATGGVAAIGGTVAPSRGDFAAISVPVLVPVLVLAVPFFDTTSTILRRLLSGRAIFSPDKEHLHHRLMEIGHSHRRAVLIMYYWSALIAFGAVGVSVLPLPVVTGVLGAGIAGALAFVAAGRLGQRLRAERTADDTSSSRPPVVRSRE
ncbi:MAG TPA: MraY family glycosyltransferase [Egibacteraceae bacterium]